MASVGGSGCAAACGPTSAAAGCCSGFLRTVLAWLMSSFSPERGLRLGEPEGDLGVADDARGVVGL